MIDDIAIKRRQAELQEYIQVESAKLSSLEGTAQQIQHGIRQTQDNIIKAAACLEEYEKMNRATDDENENAA